MTAFFKVLTDTLGHSDCPVSSTGPVIQSTQFEYTNMMVSFHQLYYDIQIYNTNLRQLKKKTHQHYLVA